MAAEAQGSRIVDALQAKAFEHFGPNWSLRQLWTVTADDWLLLIRAAMEQIALELSDRRYYWVPAKDDGSWDRMHPPRIEEVDAPPMSREHRALLDLGERVDTAVEAIKRNGGHHLHAYERHWLAVAILTTLGVDLGPDEP